MHPSGARLSGIWHITAAGFFFSLMGACVKWLAGTLPVFEVVFFRSLTGCLLIVWLMKRKRVSFWGQDKGRLFLRGTSGFIAVTLYFFSISGLPLGTAVILNFTSPIFAAVFASLFLREKPGLLLWTMIAVSFCGLMLLAAPQANGRNIYLAAGLLSGIAAAISTVSIRSVRPGESPLTIIFYFTFISTIGSTFLLLHNARWPNGAEWAAIAAIAVTAFYGQLWSTIAFRQAPASLLSPFLYLTPMLSFLLGSLLWGDPITPRTLAGTLFIILAGSCIMWREARPRPEAFS